MDKLQDHYDQELNIGDLVLGARPGGTYRHTVFTHGIIVGRTKSMIRLHQVNGQGDREYDKSTLASRGTKRGGKVLPSEVILLNKQYLTREEIDKYHDVSLDSHGIVLPKAIQAQRPKRTGLGHPLFTSF
jgi:hypothetical protein